MKNIGHLLLSFTAVTFMFPLFLAAQNLPVQPEKKMMHHEVQRDNYLPNEFNNQRTSPPMIYRSSGVFTTQVNVNSSGQNILGDAANEPNIAVDPTNPNNMVIGWRQFDNVNSDFRQAGWAYTTNAGQTWTFPGVIEGGIFRSDPVLDYDTLGNIYYNSLTNVPDYLCKVFKSSNGGATWDAGVDAKGGDKQWMAIDRTNGVGSGNIYSAWTSSYTSCGPGFFTRSTDGGASFENCVTVTGDPFWGTETVGNDGELYISGSGQFSGIVVVKSTNAKIPGSVIAWQTPVLVDVDGAISGWNPINPVGLLGQANIDVDRSNGPGRGNVYVMASVQRLSNADQGDVMFSRSTDGGETWSLPVRVNDDTGNLHIQWLAVMSVAPNGRIDAAWLDTRDAPPGSDNSALYYSYSIDQGNTWTLNQKLSESFNPHVGYPQQNKMGDYIDMVSDNEGAHLAWANTLNGEEDVYYSHIIPGVDGIAGNQGKDYNYSLSCYPNPVRTQTMISYKLPEENSVKLVISNLYGQEMATLENGRQVAGIHNVTYSADQLAPGYYFCKLIAGTHSETIRLVILK